mgnify:FL=1
MNTAVALALYLFLVGGSFFIGGKLQKDKAQKEVRRLMIENEQSVKKLLVRVDSLRHLPAKVDTIIVFQTRIIEKTDTLILINKNIYQNTDTIKNELRDYVRKKN